MAWEVSGKLGAGVDGGHAGLMGRDLNRADLHELVAGDLYTPISVLGAYK
jgi:hypothetical protein